jgi:hypothetical protein
MNNYNFRVKNLQQFILFAVLAIIIIASGIALIVVLAENIHKKGESANGATTTPANRAMTTPANGATTTHANGATTTPANGAMTTPANGATTTHANGATTTHANGATTTHANGATTTPKSKIFMAKPLQER